MHSRVCVCRAGYTLCFAPLSRFVVFDLQITASLFYLTLRKLKKNNVAFCDIPVQFLKVSFLKSA